MMELVDQTTRRELESEGSDLRQDLRLTGMMRRHALASLLLADHVHAQLILKAYLPQW